MKPTIAKRITIICCIVLSLGFAISAPEDPAVEAAREKYEESWKEYFLTRYDLGALHEFLVKEVVGAGSRASVDLSKSNVSDRWEFSGTILKCGDWTLYISNPGADYFKLTWNYFEQTTKKGTNLIKDIEIACSREGRGEKFSVLKEELREEEYVELMP